MRKVQVFLQNAWLRHQRRNRIGLDIPIWRECWLDLLTLCRSGKRLKVLCGVDCFHHPREKGESRQRNASWDFTNTTPEFAYGHASRAMPAVPKWIAQELERYQPDVVVCCGRQAAVAVPPLWPGQLLVVPHPTSRVLLNRTYEIGYELLTGNRALAGRWELVQVRGGARLEVFHDTDAARCDSGG